MTNFGDYLKTLRTSKGMTITDLANASTVSQPYLSQIESGKRKASIQIINKLADHLEIDQFELAAKAGFYTEEELMQRKQLERMAEERLLTNKEFQTHLKVMLEDALQHITYEKNSFIPEVLEDIRELEFKYMDTFGDELTSESLRDLAQNAEWQQEWILNLTVDIVNVSRKFISHGKNVIELTTFLKTPGVTYRDIKLTDKEKDTILMMLDVLLQNKEES